MLYLHNESATLPLLHSNPPIFRLIRLDDLGLGTLQFRVEDPIPETAADTKAVLVVGKVVLEMMLLQSTVPWRETGSVRLTDMLACN